MYIFKATGLRGPAYPDQTPYVDESGTKHPRTPRHLLQEIADPKPPGDYSEATYFRTEQDDAPYVVYTRKPQEMLDAAAADRAYEAAQRTLASTDWYVTRFAETGVPIPAAISEARAAARKVPNLRLPPTELPGVVGG